MGHIQSHNLCFCAVILVVLCVFYRVRRQFREIPGILEGKKKPDYARCIEISTKASLYQMIAPACLVIFTPIVGGFLFGTRFLTGVLAGL